MSLSPISKPREPFNPQRTKQITRHNGNQRLVQLPSEIFGNMADCLDLESVEALRATCKAMREACDQAMLGSVAPMNYGRGTLKRVFESLAGNQYLPAKELDFSMVDVDNNLPMVPLAKRALKVTSLNFWNCSKLTDMALVSILRSCKELKELDLTGCHLKPETIEWIKTRYPQIAITKNL